MLRGLMQDRPLALTQLLPAMERQYSDSRIITSYDAGPIEVTYAHVLQRVHALAIVLDRLGVAPGARVASFAWNTQRHLELYLAVPCSGRVLHTVNHRLFADQIHYILRDAADELVFIERSMLGAVWPVLERNATVRLVVVMDDGTTDALPEDSRILHYDELLESELGHSYGFNLADERTASGLCYTSGTTGRPKGVLYDHRSTLLHALMLQLADGYAFRRSDVIFPIVPMFHVNAWGFPYGAIMCGATLTLPGPVMAPDRLAAQMERDKVTLGAAVTTVWTNVAPHVEGKDLSRLRRLICGGGKVPPSLSGYFQRVVGVHLSSGWGMTETSPGATYVAQPEAVGPKDDWLDRMSRPGSSLPLVNFRLIDPSDGKSELPWDGESAGELEVSGPTVVAQYFNREKGDGFSEDGWLRTGDVAVIDAAGAVTVVDRVKDLIKSGGEWISSADLENVLVAHPAVAEVAVIGRSDERWGERPVVCVVLEPGAGLQMSELVAFLDGKVAKWWIPDAMVILDELPKTATGKVAKVRLRQSVGQNSRPDMTSAT